MKVSLPLAVRLPPIYPKFARSVPDIFSPCRSRWHKPFDRILLNPALRPSPEITTARDPESGGLPSPVKSDGMMPEKIVLDKQIETFYFLPNSLDDESLVYLADLFVRDAPGVN